MVLNPSGIAPIILNKKAGNSGSHHRFDTYDSETNYIASPCNNCCIGANMQLFIYPVR
jgi:hypothetical protein